MFTPMGKPKRQEQQRQDLPEGSGRPAPALWVAATPIGNLGDASARLRQVLGAGHTLLCEDTRRTLDLCRALGVELAGKTERCDAHTRAAQWDRWVERAQGGETFVLVTDAGTPGISDPGAAVVAAFARAGLGVESVPGPSAVATALSLCGFQETAYVFWGFFPRTKNERGDAVTRATALVQQDVRVHIWFESPERVADSFQVLQESTAGVLVQVAAFRELTKRFETAYRGSVAEVRQQIQAADEREEARGEWVFVLQWPKAENPAVGDGEWQPVLEIALKAGASAAGAAREIASKYGVSRNEVYAAAVQLKKFSSGD